MSNFIGLVYATLKAKGIDYSDMSVSEAVDKFNELKGNTDKQKKAESEYKSSVLDKIREKSLSHSKYASYGNSGYQGGMSKRAVSAYKSGEMPYSKWSKSAIIEAVLEYNDKLTAEDLNRLSASDLRSMFLEKSSWHHTGKYFNETSFYSVDEDKAKELTKEDVYSRLASEHFNKSMTDEQAKAEWSKVYTDKMYDDDIKKLAPLKDELTKAQDRYYQTLYKAHKENIDKFLKEYPQVKKAYSEYLKIKDYTANELGKASEREQLLYNAFSKEYLDAEMQAKKGLYYEYEIKQLKDIINEREPYDIKKFLGLNRKAKEYSTDKENRAKEFVKNMTEKYERAQNPSAIRYVLDSEREENLDILAQTIDYINERYK